SPVVVPTIVVTKGAAGVMVPDEVLDGDHHLAAAIAFGHGDDRAAEATSIGLVAGDLDRSVVLAILIARTHSALHGEGQVLGLVVAIVDCERGPTGVPVTPDVGLDVHSGIPVPRVEVVADVGRIVQGKPCADAGCSLLNATTRLFLGLATVGGISFQRLRGQRLDDDGRIEDIAVRDGRRLQARAGDGDGRRRGRACCAFVLRIYWAFLAHWRLFWAFGAVSEGHAG